MQTLNDRKTAIIGLLTRLQKPITEQLNAGQKTNIDYVVFIGKQDPSRNPFAMLAPLTKPIEAANPNAITLPAEFTATDPLTRQNISAPKYTTGDLDKPSALYVLPKSIEAACPSETSGSIAQLGSQLSHVLTDIRGEQAAAGRRRRDREQARSPRPRRQARHEPQQRSVAASRPRSANALMARSLTE